MYAVMSPPFPLLGVATSVGWNGHTYDTWDALAFAQAHGFSMLQVYLTPELIADPAARQRLKERAAGTRLLCHAPAVLGDGPGTSPQTVAAALDLLKHEPQKWVVQHFDETQAVSETLSWAERLLDAGVLPCVENFHTQPGAAAARRHYEDYLELFRLLKARGHAIPAVLDIPRCFAANLELSFETAQALVVTVSRELVALAVPVLLHLIDTRGQNVADRTQWCPLGAGTIRYGDLLPLVFAKGVSVAAIILEYEDRKFPLISREFLCRLFGELAQE